MFSNLLNNAVKYTNAGGDIWIGLTHDDRRATVSIRDNGIGIPQEQLASVFEMFTQVDRSNRLAQGGLGIGLTLVRSLVSMHGGTVEARSCGPGTGSEFVVVLPALAEPAPRPVSSKSATPFPPRRILIVDDNRDAADTLGALLTALGATVSVAYGGAAAFDALTSFDADAVLLDIGMPEIDGYEVARRLRAIPAHRDLLIIALTGWGQEHDHERSRAAGFDHHVVKPPDLDRLRELLSA